MLLYRFTLFIVTTMNDGKTTTCLSNKFLLKLQRQVLMFHHLQTRHYVRKILKGQFSSIIYSL